MRRQALLPISEQSEMSVIRPLRSSAVLTRWLRVSEEAFRIRRYEIHLPRYVCLVAALTLLIAAFVLFVFSGVTAFAQVTFVGSQTALAGGPWSTPAALAIDRNGNLFVADSGNGRVVELPQYGAGFGEPVTILSGLSHPSGLAVAWNGNVYLSDTGNNRVLMLPIIAGGFGPATTVATGLNAPAGLAVDLAGNVYIADAGNNCIKEVAFVSGAYGVPLVVALGFKNPLGVAVDSIGSLYIADTGNSRIMKQPYTGTGFGSQQFLYGGQLDPVSVAVDNNFNLYVADSLHDRALEEPWAKGANRFGTQVQLGSGFESPTAVISDPSGNIYVADGGSNQVLKVVARSLPLGNANVGAIGASVTYSFSVASGTALGAVKISTQGQPNGDFSDAGGSTCLAQTYVSLTVCAVNVRFAPLGVGPRMGAVSLFGVSGNPLAIAFLSAVGEAPLAAFLPGSVTRLTTQLSAPAGVAVDGEGNLYIADTGNNRVVEVPWSANGYGLQTTIPMSGLFGPMGLAVDGAGNLYVASNGNDKVLRFPWTGFGYGTPSRVGTGLYGPSNVAVDASGNVYLTNTLLSTVYKIAWTGSAYSQEQGLGNYHRTPVGIAVNGAGTVFFSDPYQNTVSYVQWNGTEYLIETLLRNLVVSQPTALAVDSNSNLYILDTGNNRVVMLPWNGTEFGNQITLASGFDAPVGMAIDSAGSLYIADTGNNQIVKITQSIPAAMNFANAYLGSTSADSAKVTLVENIGNQTLSLSTVNYPTDFPEVGEAADLCEGDTILGFGESCELAVDFTPQSIGSPLLETLSIEDNSGGAPSLQELPMTGTSLAQSTQSITFPPLPSATYGAAPVPLLATASSGLPVTFHVLSGPATMTRTGQTLILTGAGTVVVEATQSGNQAYRSAPPVTETLVVVPATLTVTPANETAIYGSIPSSFRYSITGYVKGDNPSVATSGSAVITDTAGPSSGAGNYLLTASRGTLSSVNYAFLFATATLTVTPAILQVSVLSQSRAYGSPMQAPAWRLSGFFNGDTASIVSGAPVLTTSANSGSPVGVYPILVLPGTLSAANYTFKPVNGVLTIVSAALKVAAFNATISYGNQLPVFGYSISGLVNGDMQASVIHGAPVVSSNATNPCGAGTYVISISAGSLAAANYTFQFVPGVLVVQKLILKVTTENASMTYGGPMPPFSYAITGFVNGDTAATSLSGTFAAVSNNYAAAAPGSYVISEGIGSVHSANYSVVFVAGVLTIAKALLTVTPANLSMTYGGQLPALAYGLTGFVNGDGGAVVKGAPQLVTQANAKSPVGSYPITGSVGSLSSSKYIFQVLSGRLTVNKASLTVRATSFSIVYGSVPPVLSYGYSGFVNGDSSTAVSGAAALTSSATSASAVGTYPIMVAIGTLAAVNYSFLLVSGQIAVTKATLAIVPASQTMTYGGTFPALRYSLIGFVNGDSQQTATSGSPLIATVAKQTSPVATYTITSAIGSLAASNYSFRFQNNSLVITKAPLTFTANSLSTTAGSAVPGLTFSVSGLVNGDSISSAVTGAPALSTNATSVSKAGTYPIAITMGNLRAGNYSFAFVNGTLTVVQASLGLKRPSTPIGRRVPWRPANLNTAPVALRAR
jgi:sugar lactone lactonase YvrE